MQFRLPSYVLIPLALALMLAVWFIPMSRALNFWSEARDMYNQIGSINAHNDLVFSQWILATYFLSLLVGLMTAVAAAASRRWPLLVPFSCAVFCPLYLTWLNPEHVIVFFPTLDPFLLIGFSILLVLSIGAVFISPPPDFSKPISTID